MEQKTIESLIDELIRCGEELLKSATVLQEFLQEGDTTTARSEASNPSQLLLLEDVRKVAAEKARDGYTDAVRELLGAYGVDKLSALDPANYAAFMSELEALGNGN